MVKIRIEGEKREIADALDALEEDFRIEALREPELRYVEAEPLITPGHRASVNPLSF